MEHIGGRTVAVVGVVVERAVATAVAVGEGRNPVGGGDRVEDGAGNSVAALPVQVGTVQHGVAAADSEGRPGGRADDPVGRHTVRPLEVPHRARGGRAEDAVGGDAEVPLGEADARVARVDASMAGPSGTDTML